MRLCRRLFLSDNSRLAPPSGTRTFRTVLASAGAAAVLALRFSLAKDALLLQETEEPSNETSPSAESAISLAFAKVASAAFARTTPEKVIQLPLAVNVQNQETGRAENPEEIMLLDLGDDARRAFFDHFVRFRKWYLLRRDELG